MQAELLEAERHRLTARRIRAERRANGLCGECGKPKRGRRLCRTCLKKRVITWKKDVEWKLSNNICTKCGKPKGECDLKWACRSCADKKNEKHKLKLRTLCFNP